MFPEFTRANEVVVIFLAGAKRAINEDALSQLSSRKRNVVHIVYSYY